ncbi:hypothetical protein K443DRAFT_4459 [Laccaria amethystina LaAM-08-1]|uniref:Unplaced genomic scaffold K443scaffold_32, whole genome shotgun sequence n=1 Tax=Laccaria amethystina LaAM-08-1 TaxID=1095629 RepID=A0A0C9Y9I7_9AGAR|nr:hypothetical protein K443DRAFT_4459 [Laccaria amethystina LaAM-08-1]
MPPITCARQTLSAICIPTQPKLLHDVQDVLLQTRDNEGSLGAARRDAVEPSLCRRDGITRIAEVCRGVADSRFSGIQHVDIAPCLSRSAAVWRLCEETEGDDERENGSRSLHDMLCSVPASIVTSGTNGTEQCNNDLREYYSIRNNLILDSTHPDAPHIVITPVEETIEDYYIHWGNRVEPQWLGCLTIPPPVVSRTRLFLLNNAVISSKTYSDESPIQRASPRLFLHTSWFNRMIKPTGRARLALHLKKALQKNQFKATAFSASRVAAAFRQKYDDPEFLSSVEKPFKWVDPAEHVLRRNAHHRGVLIIDSPSPFIIPHIMINAPPPQDFWVTWGNATNSPQDGGFGRYLVVPSRFDYINLLQSPCEDLDSICGNEVDLSESSSPSGTPFPETPICDQASDFYIQRPEEMMDDSNENNPELECLTRVEPPKFFLSDDDDEEDGLPPFDDWYQNIAARTQTMNTN